MTGSDHPNRRSMRLQGYDYSQPDAYFVTIVNQDRRCLFGRIAQGEAQLNDAGRMVEKWWKELINKFPSVELDEYIIMPNHFHAIVWLVGADLRVGSSRGEGDDVGADLRVGSSRGETHNQSKKRQNTLPEVMQWFKTMTTNEYIRGVRQNGWLPFPSKLWQRSYYDHIVRDEIDLNNIRRYIRGNPGLWEQDNENPMRNQDHP